MNATSTAGPGAFFRDGKTTFRLWAPLKEKLTLVLDSPVPGTAETRFPMTRSQDGYWEYCGEIPAGTRYKYSADDAGPLPDPASRFQPEGVHGPSEVVDPGMFQWK